MRVLVTRPEEQAAGTMARLRDLGHDAAACPLLQIHYLPGALPELTGVQAIALTSGSALAALTEDRVPRDLPVFAVGEATAERARGAGFMEVESAAGDALALAELIIARLNPSVGPLFLPRGRYVAGNLAAELGHAGFTVMSAVLYDSVMAAEIPGTLRTQLSEGEFEAVLFFSPRTAEAFVRLAADGAFSSCTQTLAALAISDAAAKPLRTLDWAEIGVAKVPTESSLLETLQGLTPITR